MPASFIDSDDEGDAVVVVVEIVVVGNSGRGKPWLGFFPFGGLVSHYRGPVRVVIVIIRKRRARL